MTHYFSIVSESLYDFDSVFGFCFKSLKVRGPTGSHV